MDRVRFCWVLFIAAALCLPCWPLAVGPANAAAQDGPVERDATAQRVERAEQDYAQVRTRARGRLTEALDVAVARAADRGDLDELEALEAQRAAFVAGDELPQSRAVRREALAYHRTMERATDDLVRVYERAVRDYTRERRIEAARLIRTKMALLQIEIDLEYIEHEGHTYAVIEADKTWHEARDFCESLGGHLVSIGSAEENAFVLGLIPEDGWCWWGASDEAQEGDWVWEDGSAMVYEDWSYKEPRNLDGRQHFLCVNKHGTWDDMWVDYDAVHSFVCEWPASVPDLLDFGGE